jgi:membrane associated rhomboid family serine protease
MANHPYRVLITLIAAAALVFAWERASKSDFGKEYGTIPTEIRDAADALRNGQFTPPVGRTLSRLVSSLFVHGDAQHVTLNMIFLWTFGVLSTQHLGSWITLAAFFITGVCGNLLQTGLNLNSSVPIIGASGAVSGLEGIYLGLALRWQLRWPDVWPIARPIPPMQLGAFAILGFAYDVYLLANRTPGIAFGAHIGGFLAGLASAGLITTLYPTIQSYHQPRRRR